MDDILDIAGGKMLLERPVGATEKVVIFLPGISGGALSDRFKPLVDAVLGAGLAIARVQLWEKTDVNEKSFKEVHEGLASALGVLKEKGYTNFYLVGKSFGGAVSLTFIDPSIQKRVLWAPAIGITEGEENFDQYYGAKLGTIAQLMDVKIGKAYLNRISGKILSVHGTADEAIPFTNSELLVKLLPDAKLYTVEGADHSYKNPEHEKQVIDATVDFLG